MKKIVKPTGYNRLRSHVDSNSVTMCATVGDEFIAMAGKHIRATVDEIGHPKCSFVEGDPENKQFSEKLNRISKRTFFACSIGTAVCFALAIVMAMLDGWVYQVAFTLSYFMLAGCLLHEGVGIFLARLFGDKEIKSFVKFHAASNATINAFNATQKVPTLEEAKQYSIFNHQNQYVKNGYMAVVFIAFSLLRFLPIWVYIATAIALVVIVFTGEKNGWLRFWQFLVTSKPQDCHYEAAIAAMSETVEFFERAKFEKITEIDVLRSILEICKKCENNDSCEEREFRKQRLKELTEKGETGKVEAMKYVQEEDAVVEEVTESEEKLDESSSSPSQDTEEEAQ